MLEEEGIKSLAENLNFIPNLQALNLGNSSYLYLISIYKFKLIRMQPN